MSTDNFKQELERMREKMQENKRNKSRRRFESVSSDTMWNLNEFGFALRSSHSSSGEQHIHFPVGESSVICQHDDRVDEWFEVSQIEQERGEKPWCEMCQHRVARRFDI